MKRNNLFMVAYIIFIFICTIGRFFGEYPRWQVLVAAITATSWIFSLADFNFTAANEIRTVSKDFLEFAEPNIENVQKMVNAIDVLLGDTKDNIKDELTKVTEELDYYNHIRQGAMNCIEDYKRMTSSAKKYNLIAQIASKTASVLTVIGFVEFFAIISFDSFSKAFINSQDIMTATAFGLILLTQYMDEVSKEKGQRYKESAERLSDRWKALRESFELEAANHAH